MSALVTTDTHLTNNPKEDERWGLLPWLNQQAGHFSCDEVLLLGDLTDAKDNHPSALVNRVCDQLQDLADEREVIILMGNHDRIDKSTPYFRFLNHQHIRFIYERPTKIGLSIGSSIWLPHTTNWQEDWADIDFSQYDYAFAHQTLTGAVAETGMPMDSDMPHTIFDKVRKKAYVGDIHVPQLMGKKVEYVGCPYRVRYGDTFSPRVIMVGTTPKGAHQQQNLVFPTKGKHVVNVIDLDSLEHFKEVPEGGAVKLRIECSRADLPLWEKTKAEAKRRALAMGWQVDGIELVRIESADATQGKIVIPNANTADPQQLFADYCKAKAAPPLAYDLGSKILAQLKAT